MQEILQLQIIYFFLDLFGSVFSGGGGDRLGGGGGVLMSKLEQVVFWSMQFNSVCFFGSWGIM